MKLSKNPNISECLSHMSKSDVWSMLLFCLYKLQDDPNWLTLSELSFVLNGTDLSRFLSYFENMTITIPPLKDLRLLVKSLTVYQLVTFENMDLNSAAISVQDTEFTKDELKLMYLKISEVLKDYEFREN